MGRLSTFAKNRILNLRFQKSYRIKQIALSLFTEDNIKVSRKSISTFLKKYIETKSIHDKPRSGRNKKLTPEEINLIGEVTRLNRDITAPKIKEYLNLNVSTYTILRASKLFEWNKLNPNSNEAKKAAALERQLNGDTKKKKANSKADSTIESNLKNKKLKVNQVEQVEVLETGEGEGGDEKENETFREFNENNKIKLIDPNLNLIDESEILLAKNVSSSPMVFATKILYKIFDLSELIGHNVSGKTFNKFIKNKQALDERRIGYIRWLVENNFETSNKEDLWKACRTAINKSIRNNELKIMNFHNANNSQTETSGEFETEMQFNQNESMISLKPNLSFFQITNDMSHLLDNGSINSQSNSNAKTSNSAKFRSTLITLTDAIDLEAALTNNQNQSPEIKTSDHNKQNSNPSEEEEKLNEPKSDTLTDSEIKELRSLCCSPMIFSTKLLLRIFSKEELVGHNVSGKTFHRNLKSKVALDDSRINYIKTLVEKNFSSNFNENIWKSCRKAINRVIRNFEIKESKLIKSIDENEHSNSEYNFENDLTEYINQI